MKILMLKGLPGSGKSTWAKQFVAQNPGWVRVNKDSLREMMCSYRQGKDESLILKWRDWLIQGSLMEKKNVVVDDTNFHPKHEKRLREIATFTDPLNIVEFEEKFFDTPLDQCIKNDLQRPNSVGEKVIKKMWREFLYQKYDAPAFDPTLPTAIICDLDGTLALHNGRNPYDASTCDQDLVNWPVSELVWNYQKEGFKLILVSGREEQFRLQTESFLARAGLLKIEGLFMRPTGDFRKDDVVKEEIYLTKILGKYNVRFVLDDRNRVVDMWRRNGLTCLQVAEGDF